MDKIAEFLKTNKTISQPVTQPNSELQALVEKLKNIR